MKYEIWSNVSLRPMRFFSGYEPGDKMKKSWEGELDISQLTGGEVTNRLLDWIWHKFNQDDRPNGQIAHSLSIGDVVVLDGEAFAVANVGWTELSDFTPVMGDYTEESVNRAEKTVEELKAYLKERKSRD